MVARRTCRKSNCADVRGVAHRRNSIGLRFCNQCYFLRLTNYLTNISDVSIEGLGSHFDGGYPIPFPKNLIIPEKEIYFRRKSSIVHTAARNSNGITLLGNRMSVLSQV